MANNSISDDYLAKIRFSVRRNQSDKTDSELKDIIEECRADMIRVGVSEEVAISEENALVLGCQRAFARWKFGISGDDAARNREDYLYAVDNLRKSVYQGAVSGE